MKKKKLFIGILAFLALLSLPFFWLFSSFGNAYIANFLIKELQNKTNLSWQVKDFSLSPSHFFLGFHTEDNSLNLTANGEFSIFLQTLKGEFLIDSKEAKIPLKNKNFNILNLNNTTLKGEFLGSFSNLKVQTQNNFANGENLIYLNLAYFKAKDIFINIKNLQLAKLLESLDKKPYFNGILNANLNIKKEAQNNFSGEVSINLEEGNLDSNVFLEQFNLEIPPTHFVTHLQGNITQNTLDGSLKLYSNIGDALIKGATNLKTLATNTDFNIKLQSLAPLSPFFKIPLNGAIEASGNARGGLENMLILGDINLQDSPLKYNLNLQNLRPNTLKIQSQNLKAQSLFTLFNQLHFMSGILNLELDLRDFKEGISGIITLNSKNLQINSPLIETHTKIGFLAQNFTLDSSMQLSLGSGILNATLDSKMLNYTLQNGQISLKPFKFSATQALNIPKLENFSYENKTLFSGILSAQGELSQDNFALKGNITNKSSINPFLLNRGKNSVNIYVSNLKESQIYRLFPKIPRYFEGVGNLHFQRDLSKKTRQINFDFTKFKLKNLNILKSLETKNCSLNQAEFKGSIYNKLLENQFLHGTITLNSKNTKLQIPKIITNLNTLSLDGILTINCDKTPINRNLKGTIYKPKLANTR